MCLGCAILYNKPALSELVIVLLSGEEAVALFGFVLACSLIQKALTVLPA